MLTMFNKSINKEILKSAGTQFHQQGNRDQGKSAGRLLLLTIIEGSLGSTDLL